MPEHFQKKWSEMLLSLNWKMKMKMGKGRKKKMMDSHLNMLKDMGRILQKTSRFWRIFLQTLIYFQNSSWHRGQNQARTVWRMPHNASLRTNTKNSP